jgi:adenosylcobinamide-phosphate synthase
VIEYSVLAAHRHVFGVLSWFSVLAAFGLGPAGAVLYRMSEFAYRFWQHAGKTSDQPVSPALLSVASRAWAAVDWLPARVTALGFAVVGSFEEAIDCWRNYAQRFPNDNDGVILAATSGAVNVRLGGEALKSAPVMPNQPAGFGSAGLQPEATMDSSESTPGREAEVAHLRSIVGLVWRSVVLWMVLLALLTLARLLG